MSSCKNEGYDILFWCIISVIFFIILLLLIIHITYTITINNFIKKIDDSFKQDCYKLPPITYRNNVYIPIENGVYEKSLADALYDISMSTTNAECINILPIPNPPTFTHQLSVQGISPINGNLSMYAYIFWNKNHSKVVFSFAGTASLSQVQSDLEIKQVAPTLLNGYKEGVLVHKGFYDIYISIKTILWNWWNDNKSWVKTLYITGKSLGGALSNICAYDFADVFKEQKCFNKFPACNSQTGSNKIKNLPIQYSFAAPRTGNVLFSNIFNKRLKTTIRVNNTEDIITELPPAKIKDFIYQQTKGSVPFTLALNSLFENHTIGYDKLPICSEVAPCFITN